MTVNGSEKATDKESENVRMTTWRDRWLRKPHLDRSFLDGLIIGVVVSWGFFSLILSPASQKALEVVIQGQQNELVDQRLGLRDLSIANQELRDSIQQMNGYGTHFGRFALTGSLQSLAGNQVKGSVDNRQNQWYLSLVIDTCQYATEWRIPCHSFHYNDRLSLGCVIPIRYSHLNYLLIPREFREDTVIVDVYRPIR